MTTIATLERVAAAADAHRLRATDYGEHGARVFHRQEFALTKFGMLDTFVVARAFDAAIDRDELKAYSRDAMALARRHKFMLPVGLFSALVTYPLAILPTVPEELATFLAGYAPKHYSAFEFPVALDASTGALHHFTGTPLWGMAYYKGFRDEVAALFGA